jgi:L-lactate dehydrogenase (cytochrome)
MALMSDLDTRYPALSDLRAKARRRLPKFVWEYLDSATGTEATLRANRAALDRLRMMPSILHGPMEHDLSVEFLGEKLALPFGIAPVGMSGLIWPGAERTLAAAGARWGIPYCLSTVAAAAPRSRAARRRIAARHGWKSTARRRPPPPAWARRRR